MAALTVCCFSSRLDFPWNANDCLYLEVDYLAHSPVVFVINSWDPFFAFDRGAWLMTRFWVGGIHLGGCCACFARSVFLKYGVHCPSIKYPRRSARGDGINWALDREYREQCLALLRQVGKVGHIFGALGDACQLLPFSWGR